jgi:hypothetical protein
MGWIYERNPRPAPRATALILHILSLSDIYMIHVLVELPIEFPIPPRSLSLDYYFFYF